MKRNINREFYNRYTPRVAQDLLGCFLVRKHKGKIIRAMITETEAYRGEHDLACHASKGRTLRTETLYAQPGTIYVYLIYGMYWMLNIVTEEKDYPAAVLVRAVTVESRPGVTLQLNGPGKLTKHLKIDKSLNGKDLINGKILWIEQREPQAKFKIERSPRIGIDYARHAKNWKWNFRIENRE